MKKISAIILVAALMLIALPVSSAAAGETYTLYFDNTYTQWEHVYVMAYNDNGDLYNNAAVELLNMSNTQLCYYVMPTAYTKLQFNFEAVKKPWYMTTAQPEKVFSPFDYAWLDLSEYGSSHSGIGDAGSTGIGVNVKYTPDSTASVISAVIAWQDMKFTYNSGSFGKWNPKDHTYSGATSGGWEATRKQITVTNHSNTPVIADFAFTSASGLSISAKFYDAATGTTAKDTVQLESAENSLYSGAPSDGVYFGITGGEVTESKRIGTIQVKLKGAKRNVSTLGELNDSLIFGGAIRLQADIDTTTADVGFDKDISFDLGKHTLKTNHLAIADSTVATIRNGHLDRYEQSPDTFIENRGTLYIENCALDAFCNPSTNAIVNYGDLYISDTTIMGEIITQRASESAAQPRMFMSGNIDLYGDTNFNIPSFTYTKPDGCTIIIGEGTYNFNVFNLLCVGENDASEYRITMDFADFEYTVTHGSSTTTYKVTQADGRWVVTEKTT